MKILYAGYIRTAKTMYKTQKIQTFNMVILKFFTAASKDRSRFHTMPRKWKVFRNSIGSIAFTSELSKTCYSSEPLPVSYYLFISDAES